MRPWHVAKRLVHISRELARQRSEAYLKHVAGTLNTLGNVHRDLNDLEAARTCFEEAVEVSRELARERPNTYRRYVAISSK